jgi:hypothetical protein
VKLHEPLGPRVKLEQALALREPHAPPSLATFLLLCCRALRTRSAVTVSAQKESCRAVSRPERPIFDIV